MTFDRDKWLAERRGGIGGSDAAAAVGLSPYKSPFRLYLEKRGEVPEEDVSEKPAVEWGNRLEDTVAQWYSDRTGERVARVNRMMWSPKYDFMFANIDRRVVGKRKGLEVKTASYWAAQGEEWGESGGTDQVPTPYVLQCQHYMAVTGWDEWDIATLIGGNDPRIYTIPRDEKTISTLVTLENVFWRCVLNGVPPPAVTIEHAKEKFPHATTGKVIEAPDEVVFEIEDYREKKAELKRLEAEVGKLGGKILDFIGDAEVVVHYGKPIATWKEYERKSYTVEAGRYRQFRIKEGGS